MPSLGGPPVSQRTATRARRGAYKKREANLKRIPAAPTLGGDVAGDPQGYKRASTYRTSRPYYHTYRQVWSQSPGVKRATGQLRRGNELLGRGERAPKKPVSARDRALGALLLRAGGRDLQKQYQRGPDKLSGEAYDKYATRLWKRAGKYYPEPKRRPQTKVDYGPESKWANAWVMPSTPDVVHVAPVTTRAFMGPKGARGRSESVLLHEWAHTRQPNGERRRPKSIEEGGAEAVNQLLAKRLHVPYTPAVANYMRWARRARGKGKGYVLKGQYR
jgi:hypothetical protein